ncbi:endonuclease domain-containing protein [Streptomyces sp. NPDC049687]|uniref:endonuclease domain-containing protein n=1 Tax=Streptomyces sp. NPDC049687 TaxID=3365596 RepID=UPI0037AD1C8B
MVARGALVCIACGKECPLSEFSPAGKGTRRAYCKPCNAQIVRLRKYGITIDQLKELEDFQGYACAICKSQSVNKGKGLAAWHIDHDHSCCGTYEKACGGCVRGLLCESCNVRGLAWYEALPPDSSISIPEFERYIANPPMRRLRALKSGTNDK